ncbi:hypothetical protein KI387_021044 [Taxus chinensis]|uniref:Heat shock protein 70 n=1 Tax=Taxus chinensis TaxID=29808 RepID=A0AA38GCS2_TAXCH|nr:hypothetical protein KI387_021044 [Taxus chinensis]
MTPLCRLTKKLWPFTIVLGKNDKPMVELAYKGERKLFAAEEISSMALVKMKMVAEQFLKCDVKNAVIAVPSYFNESQKRTTKDVGKIVGLNVMQIMNELTPAAITYSFNELKEETRNILVFDLGGGTFDVSIATVERGKLEVKAVAGKMRLEALQRLHSEWEREKRSLSSAAETVIDIDCLYEGQDFHTKIRGAKFNELNGDLFKKCMQIVEQCMEDSKMGKHQINNVVLVGSSSRRPKVQELLSQFFGRIGLCKSVNPDEAVAYGAALRAAALNKEEFQLVLVDVTPLSLGIEVSHGFMEVVVPRNTPIPTLKETTVTTMYDNQISVAFKDRGTGINNHITVTNEREKLSKDEIDRMVANADIYRKEDEEAAKKLLAKNTLQCYVF